MIHLLGTPASGKSRWGKWIANHLHGEIYSIDSYRKAEGADDDQQAVAKLSIEARDSGRPAIFESCLNRAVHASARALAVNQGRRAMTIVLASENWKERARKRSEALWGTVDDLVSWGETVEYRLPILCPPSDESVHWVSTDGTADMVKHRIVKALENG